MNLLTAAVAFLVALAFILVGLTRVGVWLIERRNAPVGEFVTVHGTRMHFVHVPAPAGADLPAIVFIHGASANLKDQMLPLRPLLEGRAEMLFSDRPGHGWSGRGHASNETPSGQADTIAALMKEVGISRAIVAAHSFGGAVAAALALEHPDVVQGLVFLSPASHPWPGGETSWYYELTAKPLIGWLFAQTVAYPAGILRMDKATNCVFAPNRIPDTYLSTASIPLVLRPSAFRANAIDVEGLYRFAVATAPRYPEINAPTVVITGDSDTVVYEEIHSLGLVRDIPGAELVWIKNLGHKPDWIAPELAVAAIEKVTGVPRDLQSAARKVELRIASDTFGADCVDTKPVEGAAAPL